MRGMLPLRETRRGVSLPASGPLAGSESPVELVERIAQGVDYLVCSVRPRVVRREGEEGMVERRQPCSSPPSSVPADSH